MRPLGPVTKDDVVAAAARLFEARGYHNTRADDIAEALNIAKPTLYARTQGKGELLEAIMEHVAAIISGFEKDAAALEGAGTPPLDALEQLFRNHVRQAIEHRAYFAVVMMDERELPAAVRTKVRRGGERYTRRIQALIERGIADGSIGADLDPRVTAHTMLAAANWVLSWYRPEGRLSAELIATRAWRVLAGGLTNVEGFSSP